jgi:hypothetical protein
MRAWLLLLMIGCGVDHQGSGPYVAVDHIAEAYQAAECTHLVACHEMPDQATCLSSTVGSLTLDQTFVEEALVAKLRYNGSLVADCFATLAASSCNPGALANRISVSQCVLGAFTGTVEAGGHCTNDIECLSDTCAACDGELACCPDGKCMGEPKSTVPPALGAPCLLDSQGTDPCAVGQYCATVCTTVKPIGTQCSATKQCGDGLECDTQTTGQCAVPPLRDQPCTPNFYCGEEGTYCEPGDDICRSVGLVGDSCAPGHVCSSYLQCNTTTQLCELYPITGADCGGSARCNDLNTYCSIADQICVPRVADGQQCFESFSCLSQLCDMTTMRCAEPPLCP